MARVGIIGSAGRMGQALHEAIVAAGHDVSGGIDQGGDPLALAKASDVLVDFSAPAALEFNLDAAIHAGIPIVVGTTGLAERHHWLVDAAAVSVPVARWPVWLPRLVLLLQHAAGAAVAATLSLPAHCVRN